MGAGESGVTEIQAQIDDAVQEQIQQAVTTAVGEVVPQTEKKEKKENSQQVEFVKPQELLSDLGKMCQKMESLKKKTNEEKKAKEEYQINNSDEISGFNLKMK